MNLFTKLAERYKQYETRIGTKKICLISKKCSIFGFRNVII